MRIINVVEACENVILGIESYGVFEEQLSQDVVEQAEKSFKEKVLANGGPMDEEQLESYVEDGYFKDGDFGDVYSVSIIWSDI
jgi:hypothetical protein